MSKQSTEEKIKQAMADRQEGKLLISEIAQKYGVCSATITVWAKKSNLALRTRGRRIQIEPTAAQKEVLKLTATQTCEEVAAKLGLHRQSVHRIVKKWSKTLQGDKPPFQPGDVTLWRGKKLTVIESTVADGTLVDSKGVIYRNFTWDGGRMPKKIGFDEKYASPGKETEVSKPQQTTDK